MATESHDKMIRAFQEYFKWQDRFENRGSDEAGIKARNALHEIRKLAMTRRQEIMDKRRERKKLRMGRNGPPSKLIKGEY
jgi:hypothetical protein